MCTRDERRQPTTNDSPLSTRREYLRRTLQFGAAGSFVGTAGCLDTFEPSSTGRASTPIREETSGMPADEFETYVVRMAERYGDNGPWGTDGSDVGRDLSFRRAWAKQLHITENGQPYQGDEDNLLLASDNALALYEIPDKIGENGDQHFLFLFWSVARVPEWKRGGGLLDGTPVFRRIQTGIHLESYTEELLVYAPDRRYERESVPLALPTPDATGVQSSYPLHKGTIEPVSAKTRVGEEGSYALRWDGKYSQRQAVMGVCEARWHPDETFSFNWEVELTGGRSHLL
jgi:hypothetical protein